MARKSFKELEHEGWEERAATYDRGASSVTGRAIGPILEGFGDLEGKRLLDIASGPGHLAGEAARRRRGSISPRPWSRRRKRTIRN